MLNFDTCVDHWLCWIHIGVYNILLLLRMDNDGA